MDQSSRSNGTEYSRNIPIELCYFNRYFYIFIFYISFDKISSANPISQLFLLFCFIDEESFWIEQTEDNPKSLKQALDENRQNHRLMMKSKGYSIEICRICNELDRSVESIYNDLNLYVNSTSTENIALREDPSIRKEQAGLIEFLRSCSQNGVFE